MYKNKNKTSHNTTEHETHPPGLMSLTELCLLHNGLCEEEGLCTVVQAKTYLGCCLNDIEQPCKLRGIKPIYKTKCDYGKEGWYMSCTLKVKQ